MRGEAANQGHTHVCCWLGTKILRQGEAEKRDRERKKLAELGKI